MTDGRGRGRGLTCAHANVNVATRACVCTSSEYAHHASGAASMRTRLSATEVPVWGLRLSPAWGLRHGLQRCHPGVRIVQGLRHGPQQCHSGTRFALPPRTRLAPQPTCRLRCYRHPHKACGNAATCMWCAAVHLPLAVLLLPAQGSWQRHYPHNTSGTTTVCTTMSTVSRGGGEHMHTHVHCPATHAVRQPRGHGPIVGQGP